MAYFAHSRPVADGIFDRVFGLSFGDMFAAVTNWNDQRLTRNALNKLSDRELSDIGMCRAEIDEAVSRMR